MNKGKPLTMKRIYDFVQNYCAVNNALMVPSRLVYRSLSAHRDKETWDWLFGEIMHNRLAYDKLAPITLRGSGRRGIGTRYGKNRGGASDPYMFMTSEEWDESRDWDAEHAQ